MKVIRFDKNLWISALLALGLYLVCYTFFTVRYEENDDLIMSLIAKGYFTGSPDFHLVYINSLTGRLLSGLYLLNQTIDWYSVLLLFLQFISFVAIFYGLLTKNIHNHLLVLFVCFPFAYFIINPQFTSITILLAFAGTLLFETLEPETYFGFAAPILFLVLSSLIRFEAFAFAFLIGFIFIVKRSFTEKRVVSMIVLVVLIGSAQIINRLDYRESNWQYFIEYVQLLSKVGDNPNTQLNKEIAARSVNIPEDEFKLLSRYLLTNNFDKSNLEKIHGVVSAPENIWKPLVEVPKSFRHYYTFELALLILLVLSVLYNRLLIAPILMINLLMVVIILQRPLKDRVVLCSMVMVIVLCLINLPNLKKLYVFLLGILLLIPFSTRIYRLHSVEPVNWSILSKDKNYVTLSVGNMFRAREVYPFNLKYLDQYNILIGGWLINSPLMVEQLKRMGVSAEPHISIIDNDLINEKCLYIDRNNQYSEELLVDLQNYLTPRGKSITVVSKNEDFIIYQIAKTR